MIIRIVRRRLQATKALINIDAVEFAGHCRLERAGLALSSAIDTKSNLNAEIFDNMGLWVEPENSINHAAFSIHIASSDDDGPIGAAQPKSRL